MWARDAGAAKVLAIDSSRRMLERAKARILDQAIEFRLVDMEAFDLPSAAFDCVFSSLAFHYVENFPELARRIASALSPDGRLVFSIEHPIYTAPSNPSWTTSPQGARAWPLNCYANEGLRRTRWLGADVTKYHRTIGSIVAALLEAGLSIVDLVEWAPSATQIVHDPALAEELDRPMFLLVSAAHA